MRKFKIDEWGWKHQINLSITKSRAASLHVPAWRDATGSNAALLNYPWPKEVGGSRLNLIMPLRLTSTLQEIQWMEEHVKWYQGDTVSQIQNIVKSTGGNSLNSLTSSFYRGKKKGRTVIKKKKRDLRDLKTKYNVWIMLRSSFEQISYKKTVWRQLGGFGWHLEIIVHFSELIIILRIC